MVLTQKLLKEIVEYKDGKLFWKVRSTKTKIGAEAGSLTKYKSGDRYRICILGHKYLRSRLIFLYFNGYIPDFVDHKDLNKLNDKIENLREATSFQNMSNRKSHKGSTSKYSGVSLSNNRWMARISTNNKAIYLGMFKSEIDAAIAYNKAALIYHGAFANLNIIDEI